MFRAKLQDELEAQKLKRYEDRCREFAEKLANQKENESRSWNALVSDEEEDSTASGDDSETYEDYVPGVDPDAATAA